MGEKEKDGKRKGFAEAIGFSFCHVCVKVASHQGGKKIWGGGWMGPADCSVWDFGGGGADGGARVGAGLLRPCLTR